MILGSFSHDPYSVLAIVQSFALVSLEGLFHLTSAIGGILKFE